MPMLIRLTEDKRSGGLPGAQIVGHYGTEVAKRIEVFATALYQRMEVRLRLLKSSDPEIANMRTDDSRMRGMRMFPMMFIAMMIIMAIVCLLLFTRDGFRPPWTYWIEGRGSETALEIVEKRYARGEIAREEFQQIRQTLMSDDKTTREAGQ